MILQIEKVNPAGVNDKSYVSERFPTVLTKMSDEPKAKKKISSTRVLHIFEKIDVALLIYI